MNENTKYDNGFSNAVLMIVGTIVRTLERAIVVFWDGLRSATEHGTPSLLGFVAALLPVVMPLPIAAMTALSMQKYLGWEAWQALTMAIGIEGAGFVLWVTLVETLMEGGWKGTIMQYFFGGAVVDYEALLVTVNTVLAATAGEKSQTVLILFLACLFPALSAISYGYRNHGNKKVLESERETSLQQAERLRLEQKELDEKIRQERREDRFRMQQMKLAADVKQEQLQDKKSFRKPS